ncbi:hypothetical protein EVAR_16512_1 [Eumeta japonica]|uniref:Uncharacterized protein n=1 Tax=Eumeta variegata TaxID=151549 RepID=A0A4C1U300_EUMVA|nr:hypothetical protein EVAR_16512_1 [Eumeta japonica]
MSNRFYRDVTQSAVPLALFIFTAGARAGAVTSPADEHGRVSGKRRERACICEFLKAYYREPSSPGALPRPAHARRDSITASILSSEPRLRPRTSSKLANSHRKVYHPGARAAGAVTLLLRQTAGFHANRETVILETLMPIPTSRLTLNFNLYEI